MNTTFVLDGGAGRVICAIPALESYHKNNPDDDFKVLVTGWDPLFHHHPVLGPRTYSLEEPNSFEKYIYNNRCVSPEPYKLYEYYHNKCSMAQAFDILINGSLTCASYKPNLYVNYQEDKLALHINDDLSLKTGKENIIVIQPFGSTSTIINKSIVDHSGRGISDNVFNQIVDKLTPEATVIYFGPPELWKHTNRKTHHIFKHNPTMRDYMAMIANCDYFVGCDSVGQHMARAFNKPSMVLMGGTFESNVSYPDCNSFKLYRKPDTMPTYNPMRFSPQDNELADNNNRTLIDFNRHEINEIVTSILDDIHG